MISSLPGPREHRLPSPRGPGAADVAGEMGPRCPPPPGSEQVGSAQSSAPRPEAHCLCPPASAPQRPPLGRGGPPRRLTEGQGQLACPFRGQDCHSLVRGAPRSTLSFSGSSLYPKARPRYLPPWDLLPMHLESCPQFPPRPPFRACQ